MVSVILKKFDFKVFAIVSKKTSLISMDNNITMSLAVEIGHVATFIHVVTDFGHVLMDVMKRTVVKQYALQKLFHVYILTIIPCFAWIGTVSIIM
jgi:hypothetical protein